MGDAPTKTQEKIGRERIMKITVTQSDINQGALQHSVFRPIARAVERATGNLAARVGYLEICWGDVGGWLEGSAYKYRMKTPAVVCEFMRRLSLFIFDSGLPVEPFTFELERSTS